MSNSVIAMKALLESGVHFGHRTNKWHPAMKPYIFTERNGIHIIDLQQTVKAINNAYEIIRDCVANNGTVLFVGTKRQAMETIKEEAVRCGMPYVTERWLGGMITNWTTIFQRIMELDRLEKMTETGDINRLTKKEGLMISREINRLLIRLSGVRKMTRLPTLMFVVDVVREATAIHEANLKRIPVVALVDTNCDPSNIDYVIPSNDDAIRAIKLLVGKMADAVLEGKAMRKEDEVPEGTATAESAAIPELLHEGIEEEIEDETLLGKATMAKLASAKAVAEKEEAALKEAAKEDLIAEEKIEVKPAKAEKKAAKPEEAAKPEKKAAKAEKPAKTAKKAAKAEEPAKPEKKAAKVEVSVKAEKKSAKEEPAKPAKKEAKEKKPAKAEKEPSKKKESKE
jgi:small subunit ribosomal protein S2